MENQQDAKKKFYKRWWVWVIGVFVLLVIIGASGDSQPSANQTTAQVEQIATQPSVATSSIAKDIQPTVTQKKSVTPAPVVAQPKTTNSAPATQATAPVPPEYKAALNKATEYANTMRMSKKGVYLQLTSDYGEKFTPEAAQYAIDNVKADWNANALAKAKDYQSSMNMSPAKIHDQLTSSYGEKFTQSEADYAIQHLND